MSIRSIAVLAGPHAVALDEFEALSQLPGLRLVHARAPADCSDATWIVLAGSTFASADLAWMRRQGLDTAVTAHAARGGAVLGLGSGVQMLGEALIDLNDLAGNAPGLGLLALVTQFEQLASARTVEGCFGQVHGAWRALSGLRVRGEQWQSGHAQGHPAMLAKGHELNEVMLGLAWQDGSGQVLGVNFHGLFTQPEVMQALLACAA